ncbi:hypothetical protein A8926_7658 [Saccharopolyspora spinosa]|uniref:Uncharacterized protein n=1 Tax=Saccharopolyspora spinosa TaxID=60894 RepID=A0A2N3Y994_SACSN|nr:hypothetical protein A8926_7658 [Saccharopolyspora spinosa]
MWWLRSVGQVPSLFLIHDVGNRAGEHGCTPIRRAFVWQSGAGLFRVHCVCREPWTPQPCRPT